MIQHDNILFVPVPEDASIDHIGENWESKDQYIKLKLKDGTHSVIYLPTGNWHIIGTTDIMGEEEWQEVVEHFTDYEMRRSGYKNYKFWAHEYDVFKTATASGHSLLQSLGITARCVVLINKQ